MAKTLPHTIFTDYDIYLFRSGKHTKLYDKFGAHLLIKDGVEGCYFSVYAPAAKSVFVIGDFNQWNDQENELSARWDSSGIWEGFIPNAKSGDLYKYKIHSAVIGETFEKTDPFAFFTELAPKNASIIWNLKFDWKDKPWLKQRSDSDFLKEPISVYEVHLASWQRNEDNSYLSYSELSKKLVDYVVDMEFTHVEFMPIMEYPYDPSWGYQVTSYFAPTCRFGHPQQLMELIQAFHEKGIGIFLDWVPSHFPDDSFGLAFFDGSFVYEHPDPRRGYHPDWKSLIFNYGRNEIRSFLLSSAHFWIDKYHFDGLRVDGVASMIYLDYSRKEGEWEPNEFGGKENLEAISFLKDLNVSLFENHKGILTIAEESTSFPLVSRPTYLGGLGFSMKWMMGWMNDVLDYFSKDNIHRAYHQNNVSFSFYYAFHENFMLPLSHDEVTHGKGSMINKMSGDWWQKRANLRLLYSLMYCHSGAKLLFMGSEFAQLKEWSFDHALDWQILENNDHFQMQQFVKNLNILLKGNSALHEKNFDHEGFEWIDYSDNKNSVIAFYRKSQNQTIAAIFNFLPDPKEDYDFGVSGPQDWNLIFNSDEEKFGGSNFTVKSSISTVQQKIHDHEYCVNLILAPMACMIYEVTFE